MAADEAPEGSSEVIPTEETLGKEITEATVTQNDLLLDHVVILQALVGETLSSEPA